MSSKKRAVQSQRGATVAPRSRYVEPPRRDRNRGTVPRDDVNRRTIAFAILVGGILVAVFVILAGYQARDNPGSSGTAQGGPTAADSANIARIQQQLQRDPTNTGAMVALGNAYYDSKQWGLAIPWYERALESIPKDNNVRTDLGTAYLYSGNPDKAKEQWLKVIDLEPNKIETHYNLGVLYSSQTPPDIESAAKEWETVIKINPNSQQAKDAEQSLKRIGRR